MPFTIRWWQFYWVTIRKFIIRRHLEFPFHHFKSRFDSFSCFNWTHVWAEEWGAAGMSEKLMHFNYSSHNMCTPVDFRSSLTPFGFRNLAQCAGEPRDELRSQTSVRFFLYFPLFCFFKLFHFLTHWLIAFHTLSPPSL